MMDRVIQEQLRTALDAGQIVAVYQPQVDVSARRVVAVEVLARWMHPVDGVIAPGVFIPVAERGAEIHDLGTQMLRDAWGLAAEFRAAGFPLDVSVNVSATQLADPGFADRVIDVLARSEVPESALTLEITESHAVLDVGGVVQRLRRLRELGVGVSIDDFGVGHSSMARVEELPVSEIKVDISMVQDESDDGYAAFLEIVEYAHDNGIRIVAEGVETPAQLRRVEALRCQRAQGFLFARPLDRVALTKIVARGGRV